MVSHVLAIRRGYIRISTAYLRVLCMHVLYPHPLETPHAQPQQCTHHAPRYNLLGTRILAAVSKCGDGDGDGGIAPIRRLGGRRADAHAAAILARLVVVAALSPAAGGVMVTAASNATAGLAVVAAPGTVRAAEGA